MKSFEIFTSFRPTCFIGLVELGYLNWRVFIVMHSAKLRVNSHVVWDLRESIGLEESRATCESVSVRSPLFPVTGLAVNIPIRTVAGDDRIQGFGAVMTFVAFPVPLAALGEHLLGGENDAAAAGTTLARRSLDYCGVDYGGARSRIAASQKIICINERVVFILSDWADCWTVRIMEKRLILSDHLLSILNQAFELHAEKMGNFWFSSILIFIFIFNFNFRFRISTVHSW